MIKEIKEKSSDDSKPPEVYYLSDNNKYYMEDATGVFRGYVKGPVASRLEFHCSMSKQDQGAFFEKIYSEQVVDCVTAIGGHRKGLHEIGSKRVLVPREQRRIRPEGGDWAITKKYLLGMLGEEQFEWYLGWLKTWMSGYYGYQNTIGQVLILIGETASGKTLLKDLHNYIFDGGGQPLKYMTGGTGFNGELCSLCSLYIDDKLNDLGPKGKKKLKAECKEIAVAGELRFEFKNQTAFTASPCFRLLICCNYTEDSVSVIPDVDESTKNKISILHCARQKMPMPAGNAIQRAAFWDKLKSEMPAFIHYVLNEHEISENLSDVEEGRMGVRGYHNEEAMKYVETYSQDGSRLLAIIEFLRDVVPGEKMWVGSAGELVKVFNGYDIEKYATATSIGRFLSQRIGCGSKFVEDLGHRKYGIDLSDPMEAEITTKEDESSEPVGVLEDQYRLTDDEEFDEDAPYGRCFETGKYN